MELAAAPAPAASVATPAPATVQAPRRLHLVPPDETPGTEAGGDCNLCSSRPKCRELCPPFLARARLPPAEGIEHKEVSGYTAEALERRVNLASGVHHRRGGAAFAASPLDDDDAVARRSRTKGWEAVARRLHPHLERALDGPGVLSDHQRDLIRRYLRGDRGTDIARDRGVTKVTVSVMYRRAREHLAAVLTPHL